MTKPEIDKIFKYNFLIAYQSVHHQNLQRKYREIRECIFENIL